MCIRDSRWRARACAILSGIGTVRDDDPQLNVRAVATSRQPLKVVVDSALELPLESRVLNDGGVLVATASEECEKSAALRARGAEVVCLPNAVGKVDLPALLDELGRRGINELHVEGGLRLNGALLAAGLVDELLIYLAPVSYTHLDVYKRQVLARVRGEVSVLCKKHPVYGN